MSWEWGKRQQTASDELFRHERHPTPPPPPPQALRGLRRTGKGTFFLFSWLLRLIGSGHARPGAAGLASANALQPELPAWWAAWARAQGSDAVASPPDGALVRGEDGHQQVRRGLCVRPRVAAGRGPCCEGARPSCALPGTLRGDAPPGARAVVLLGGGGRPCPAAPGCGGAGLAACRSPSTADLFLPCRGRRRDGKRRCGCEQSFRDCCLNWAVTFRKTAGSFWLSASSYSGLSL